MDKKENAPVANEARAFSDLWTALVKEVGLAGAVLFVLMVFFIWFSSDAQKTEFIDRFILLKNTSEDPMPCIYVVAALIALLIGVYLFYSRTVKRIEKELDRCSEKKSELQQGNTDREVHSSD